MRQGQLRDKITDAVDEIESALNDVLEPLKAVEDIANWDLEALDPSCIDSMQTAIIEAIKAAEELSKGLY